MLETEDYGKDLATVQNLSKKHQLLEADVRAHEDRIGDLNEQVSTCKDYAIFRVYFLSSARILTS